MTESVTRSEERAPVPGSKPAPGGRRSRRNEGLTTAVLSGVGAMAAVAMRTTLGDVHGPTLHQKLFAFVGAGAFLVLAVLAVQSTATTLAGLLHGRARRTARGAVRILFALLGYAVVFFVELGLLGVPVERLLIGAGVVGVVLGIAAQQALGNVFAGLVLMVARPFRLDQRVRLRAGSLGGIFEATIKDVGLVYVTLDTDDGIINVPNSIMLQIGVGPVPPISADGGRRR